MTPRRLNLRYPGGKSVPAHQIGLVGSARRGQGDAATIACLSVCSPPDYRRIGSFSLLKATTDLDGEGSRLSDRRQVRATVVILAILTIAMHAPFLGWGAPHGT